MVYSLDFVVRDYECDLQGIVNNANYQHYYEHTRHQFLLENNISFAKLHEENIDFVVARANMSFKRPLKSGDKFVSELSFVQEGIKYIFYQKIYSLPDRKLCNLAQFDCVCLCNGKLSTCDLLTDFVKKFSEK